MNTIFSNRAVRGGRGSRRLLAATLTVIILFALDVFTKGAVRGLVRLAGYEVWNAGSKVHGLIFDNGFLASRRALESENEKLKQEIIGLEVRAAGNQILEEENVSLRKIVHLAEAGSGVTAPIVSSLQSSPYGTFMIGVGSEDAVAAGDFVLISEGDGLPPGRLPGQGAGGEGSFLLGVVSDAGKHLSLVKEIFAPNTSIEASIAGVPLTIHGQGGENARGEIPRGTKISVGDTVFSPQFRARAIGVVGAISNVPSRAEATVYIRLPISLSAIRYVYVVSIP